MKRITMAGVAVLAALAVSGARAEMSLQDASAKVEEAANSSSTMTSVIKQLSADDQAKFLASVNESISEMPVSKQEKVDKAVAANQAALSAAPNSNRDKLMAETYATAPLASLAVLNENLGSALAKTIAKPENKSSDEAKAKLQASVKKIMDAIEGRTREESDGAKRTAAAILMFARADRDLEEALLKDEPDAEQLRAWVDVSIDHDNYKWLTGSSEPVRVSVSPAAPDALSGNVFADLLAGVDAETFTTQLLDPTQYALPDDLLDTGTARIPRTLNDENKWYNAAKRGDEPGDGDGYTYTPSRPSSGGGSGGGGTSEPGGYAYQYTL